MTPEASTTDLTPQQVVDRARRRAGALRVRGDVLRSTATTTEAKARAESYIVAAVALEKVLGGNSGDSAEDIIGRVDTTAVSLREKATAYERGNNSPAGRLAAHTYSGMAHHFETVLTENG